MFSALASSFPLTELNHTRGWKEPHRISTVPSCHHDLTALQQQEAGAALPSTVDFLNEGCQVLKALPPPLLQEEELRTECEEEFHHSSRQHCRLRQTRRICSKQMQLCKAGRVLLGFLPSGLPFIDQIICQIIRKRKLKVCLQHTHKQPERKCLGAQIQKSTQLCALISQLHI